MPDHACAGRIVFASIVLFGMEWPTCPFSDVKAYTEDKVCHKNARSVHMIYSYHLHRIHRSVTVGMHETIQMFSRHGRPYELFKQPLALELRSRKSVLVSFGRSSLNQSRHTSLSFIRDHFKRFDRLVNMLFRSHGRS